MSLRLQEEVGKPGPETHSPRHREGAGPRSLSAKLRWPGVMPVSTTAMTSSDPKSDSASKPVRSEDKRPRNSGERVVSGCRTSSGMTARKPGMEAR